MFRAAGPAPDSAFLLQHLHDQLRERMALIKPGTAITTSVGVLSTANDVPGELARIYRDMKPGVFMAAFYGGGTLAELRTSLLAAEAAVTGCSALRVAPTIAASSTLQLMQRAGFADPVVDSDVTTMTYATPDDLVADLRAANMTGVLATTHFLPRTVWKEAVTYYQKNFGDTRARCTATFETIFLTGWKNQQPQ